MDGYMAFEEEILAEQLKCDEYHNEEAKVSGIAQLAVDKGWSNLTPAQQNILRPFLSKRCEGVRDPAGVHNDCKVVLTEGQLSNAYDEYFQYDALLCLHCQDEANDIEAHRASFMKD